MDSIFTLFSWTATMNHDDLLTKLESISIDDFVGSRDFIQYLDDSKLEAPVVLIKRILRYSDAHRNARSSFEGLNDIILN